MKCIVQEDKEFQLKVSGHTYECQIIVKLVNNYKYYYIYIDEIINITKKFIFIKYNKTTTEFVSNYVISVEKNNEINLFKRPHSIIEGKTYYELTDVKKWLKNALKQAKKNHK